MSEQTAAISLDTRLGVLRWLLARDLVSKGTLLLILALHGLRTGFEVIAVLLGVPVIQYLNANGDVAALAMEHWYWARGLELSESAGIPVSLWVLAAVMFVSLCLREALTFLALLRTQRLKETMGIRLTTSLFRASIGAAATHVRALGPGRFVPLLSNHAYFAAAILINMITVVTAWLTLGVYSVIFFIAAPEMVLVLAVLAPLGWVLTRRLYARAKTASKSIAGGFTDLAQLAGELYRSWRYLKLAPTIEPQVGQVRRQGQRIAASQMDAVKAAGMLPLTTLPLLVGLALAGLVVAVDVLEVALAVVMIWFLAALRAVPLVQTLSRARHGYATLLGPLLEVHRAIEAAEAAREVDTGDHGFTGLTEALSFQDVRFTYPGEAEAVLKGVSASVPAGRLTVLVGPSGSGKSTMIDLIPRLLSPTAGIVAADGTDLARFTLASLRGRISYLPQAPYLVDDSIAANVTMGRPGADRAAIERACALANSLDFIRALPDGLDTRLGEAGDRLSGGQRQRIALARAFLATPDILILDEPTTGLDPDSEAAIVGAILRFRDERKATVLLVTHNAALARHADHVICLRDGLVEATGAPAELVQGQGWAARFLKPAPAFSEAMP